MKCKALILDLDDTIFRTKSMDSKVFEPFFSQLQLNLKSTFDEHTVRHVINDLWVLTWDNVIKKYNIPVSLMKNSIEILDDLDLKLSISTFPDYHFIRKIQCPKFLVTTSLTSLQKAKIKALNIEHDFTKIIINDTFKESRTKHDIFAQLIMEFGLLPETTWVIGDNSESEIKAGNSLNMVTVQILREGVIKGNNAKHYISSFSELECLFAQ